MKSVAKAKAKAKGSFLVLLTFHLMLIDLLEEQLLTWYRMKQPSSFPHFMFILDAVGYIMIMFIAQFI